ncbi:MORN motif [Trema orientale]|uniref:MORN motif n=1 Tax=Trema orientale TaxID=63057 RepID=A0A2P5FZ88_TREOI|nr:MORN motif [Trema orientale]
MMAQTPSSLSHSPTLSSLRHFRHSTQTPPSSSSFGVFPFTTRSLALRIVRHFRCAQLLRIHFRLLILLSLPSLYYTISNPRRSFVLDFLSLLAFSAALLVSLNLALPRLVSIRLFLTRSLLPTKACSPSCASKPSQPVLWSIGSKPKSEKRINSGSWVKVYGNGDVYEGEFHKGKCSGSGVYYYHMSGRYEGDWIDEKYDGYGVETWAKGSRYRGQYRQGLRHGVGVYRFYTGDVYAGEWSSGQCHGCGVHTCEDGSRYIGEFKWGVKHGLGHYHFRNGDKYAGEYFADKMHGFGVYRFANGHRYEGAWHEGRRQGLGMYTFRNGETQSGHWQNGFLDVTSKQNTHPESPRTISHSRVLNAVQEAQRAAERAHNLAKVDERVNRSLAGANKAANAARVAAVKAVQNQMLHDNREESLSQFV